MREINVLDLFADVMQHHAALERDRAQMRRQQRKVVRRQRGQEVVEASVLELPGKGGRGGGHRCRSCFKTAPYSPIKSRENAFSLATPSEQSVYAQKGSNQIQQRTRAYHPSRSGTRSQANAAAGGLRCGKRRSCRLVSCGKAGAGHDAAGAEADVLAGKIEGWKLLAQPSIRFEQLCGVAIGRRHLLNDSRSVRRSSPRPGDRRGRSSWPQFRLLAARLLRVERHDFERRVAYGSAEELALVVGHLQEPARPPPRIASGFG